MKVIEQLHGRMPAVLALGIPVLGGLGYLAAFGAPPRYIAVNAAALGFSTLWIAFGKGPATPRGRRALVLALLAVLFLPLLTGPFTNGVARWLQLGPFTLHSGALAFPALAVLAAQDEDYAPPILLAALLAASMQPDAALGFAVVFAAVGLHDVTKDWRVGTVCVIGFLASMVMATRGELPAQPFVEGVLREGIYARSLIAPALFLALVAAFVLMLHFVSPDRRANFALAGSLFGFFVMSLMSNYPSILIGYGAAPILGYGLALGLCHAGPPQSSNHEAPSP